jgi:hypothetical protein
VIREEITKISFGDQHKAPEPKSFKMANGMLSSTPSDTLKVMEESAKSTWDSRSTQSYGVPSRAEEYDRGFGCAIREGGAAKGYLCYEVA